MRCYQCMPDLTNIGQKSNSPGLSFCANPNKTIHCSKDPFTGKMTGSCLTASVTVSVNTAGNNYTLPESNIDVYVLNCSVMSTCSTFKTQFCQSIKSVYKNIPILHLKSCDLTCCKGDLCNNPSSSSTVPSSVPPASALFGIQVLMTLTVVNF